MTADTELPPVAMKTFAEEDDAFSVSLPPPAATR
jgi:hypothetical protein